MTEQQMPRVDLIAARIVEAIKSVRPNSLAYKIANYERDAEFETIRCDEADYRAIEPQIESLCGLGVSGAFHTEECSAFIDVWLDSALAMDSGQDGGAS